MIGLLLFAGAALAGDPSFGSELSLGVAAGALLGDWPAPGLHTAWSLRYGAFLDDRLSGGPQLGLGVSAHGTALLLQARREDGDEGLNEAPFSYLQYGVLVLLRTEPELPWGGSFGLGMARLDLDDYYGDRHAVPMLTFEGALRQRVGQSWFFVDYGARGGWGSAGHPGEGWQDWWELEAVVMVGAQLR